MQKMQKKRAISLFSTVAPAMILYPMDDTSLSVKLWIKIYCPIGLYLPYVISEIG